MKIKLISCEAFYRELCMAVAKSPHVFDIEFLPFGLHDTPDQLRVEIQKEIDASENGKYDYIVLGYGLCSRGTADIKARSVPIVVPRMHDCITAFLGSRKRYDEEFGSHPGTYYYTAGWIERKDGEAEQGMVEERYTKLYEAKLKEYVEKYGEENAEFLMEQEKQWLANYNRAAFINLGIGDVKTYRAFTQGLATERGWDYAEIEGDNTLIDSLANGNWDADIFLKVEPGQTIAESFDELIIRATVNHELNSDN